MSNARRYAVWPDSRSRSRSRVLESHSRGVDRQSHMGLIFKFFKNFFVEHVLPYLMWSSGWSRFHHFLLVTCGHLQWNDTCAGLPCTHTHRPRSWSSRTHRSTWLFCRSTLSTSSTSRRFYDSTRLGWFPIDLIDFVDLRPCWSQLSARACLLHGNWRKKNLCPITWFHPSSKWKAYVLA